MGCSECGSSNLVCDYTTSDRICTDCGTCCFECDVGWQDCAVDYATSTVVRKSVHVPEKYLEKKLKAFKFTSEQNIAVVNGYRLVSSIWQSVKGRGRTYRPNYLFIIRKILELQGHWELSRSVPPIKTRSTLVALDIVWGSICAKLQIRFIPSL